MNSFIFQRERGKSFNTRSLKAAGTSFIRKKSWEEKRTHLAKEWAMWFIFWGNQIILRKNQRTTLSLLTIIEEQCKDWAKRIPSLIAIASVMLTSKQTRPLTILKPTTLLAESWITKPNPTLPSLLNPASLLSFRTWERGGVHLIFLWEEFWEPRRNWASKNS